MTPTMNETVPAGLYASAFPLARLGILGGGQLARMTTMKAKKLGCHVHVLDPQPQSPAGMLATMETVGALNDAQAIREVVSQCDVTTYDIEHIDTAALLELEAEGFAIQPRPGVLRLIQDKLHQKQAFDEHGIPTAPYARADAPGPESLAAFGYPLVQKARRGGYDGKGVAVLESPQDLGKVLPVPSILERRMEIEKEIAVLVARSTKGEVAVYDPVEMVFDPRGNLLDLLAAPARIPSEVAGQARELASRTVTALEGVGIFGVEMFWTREGKVLINEIAPRPHNSGHYTIEACMTCQFEQHVRAVLGLPLGSTRQMAPCAMVNLLGETGASGPPAVQGLPEALAMPGVSVHLYGKSETRPLRKMGHVTIIDDYLDRAIEKARHVRDMLRIGAGETA